MFAMGSSVKFSTRFFILRHLPGMGCQTGSKTSKHGIAPLAKQATIAQESSNNFKLLGSYSFGTHQKSLSSLLSSSCGWSVVPRPPYSLTCLVIIDLLSKQTTRDSYSSSLTHCFQSSSSTDTLKAKQVLKMAGFWPIFWQQFCLNYVPI